MNQQRTAQRGAAAQTGKPALNQPMPHSAEGEAGVLGSMLVGPEFAAPIAMERLTPESFYATAHQIIFAEMCTMYDSFGTIDLILLSQRLQDAGKLEDVGGLAYLTDLMIRVPTAQNIEHYARLVADKFLLRKLITAGNDAIMRSFGFQDDVEELVSDTVRQIQEITEGRVGGGFRAAAEIVKSALQSIERLYEKGGAVTGVATGFLDIDNYTAGLHAGEMIVIAGRPGSGKTALALNIAEHVAVEHGRPVGIFSLEMSNDELMRRMIASYARVNLQKLVTGFAAESDYAALTTAAGGITKSPLFVDDTAGLTIGQLRARAVRLKKAKDICLLMIDYLQLVRAPSKRADMSRQVEVSDISQGVKALAKELEIPILALCQLNRQPEERAGGKPKLADLRESGSLEQDADVVGLLFRPEMYAEENRKQELAGKAQLIIAKQRNGPSDVSVALTFKHELTRFENAAKPSAATQGK